MGRALVLSGGGPVGIAWETGVLAGLASGGCDLTDADLIVGTSAGSAVGAALGLGRSPAEQLQRYRPGTPAPAAQPVADTGGSMAKRLQGLFAVLIEAFAEGPSDASRAKIGRFALEADTASEESFLAAFSDLADQPFPPRFVATAVDAESGAFVTWNEDSNVPLDRAVASSCAVPGVFPPITIDGRRYIDGGMRSGANADLASGHERVVVLSVIGSTPGSPFGALMDAEIQGLRDGGSDVRVIAFDAETSAAVGLNLMDPSLSPVGAEHGMRQGAGLAAELATFWS